MPPFSVRDASTPTGAGERRLFRTEAPRQGINDVCGQRGNFADKEAPLELERFLECRPKPDRLLARERPLEE